MRRYVYPSTLVLSLLALIVVLAALRCSEQNAAASKARTAISAKGGPGSTPAYTAEQAQAHLKEVLPLVEKAAGRKFKRVPPCELVRPEQLVPVLTKELAPRIHVLMPQTTAGEAKLRVKQLVAAMVPHLLGKYGTDSQTLYLLPSNLQPQMKLAKVDKSYQQAVVKLVVAHELTHALQDQNVGLARMLRLAKTQESLLALGAVVEGHAVFVQDKVAEALKLVHLPTSSCVRLLSIVLAASLGYDG